MKYKDLRFFDKCFFLKFFLLGTYSFLFLTACLDIPNTPNTDKKVTQIGVYWSGADKNESSSILVNSKDPFSLIAYSKPSQYHKHLKFYWYQDQKLIKEGDSIYIQSPQAVSKIPNRLVAKDPENHSLEFKFKVLLNDAPQMQKESIPQNQDTLFGDFYTAFLFSWKSYDPNSNDRLQHYIQIDDTVYETGTLTSIQQSGFAPGKHSYSIWVVDSYGASDTLKNKVFYVMEAL